MTFSLLEYCQPETLSNISSHYGDEKDNDEDDERKGSSGRGVVCNWQVRASLIGKDVQTRTCVRTAKWQSSFQKLGVRVNIRLDRHSAGGLSAGFIAHHAHSKHVRRLFWVGPTPLRHPPSNHTPTSLSPSIIPFLLPLSASLHLQLPPLLQRFICH